jgi:hypothetical protein
MSLANTEGLANVERISVPPKTTPVADELAKLTGLLREVCPSDAAIGFQYDGRLHLHIHLRRSEDVTKLEAILPTMCGGFFHDVHRGQVGRHSFLHRVGALVAR